MRPLLSRAWACLQDLDCTFLETAISIQLHDNPTMQLAYNLLCLAVQSLSSRLIYAGMPEQ